MGWNLTVKAGKAHMKNKRKTGKKRGGAGNNIKATTVAPTPATAAASTTTTAAPIVAPATAIAATAAAPTAAAPTLAPSTTHSISNITYKPNTTEVTFNDGVTVTARKIRDQQYRCTFSSQT